MNTQNDNIDEEVICSCSGTTRAKIKQLFYEGMDMEAISNWSGTLSGCGGCEWDVEHYLKELAELRKE